MKEREEAYTEFLRLLIKEMTRLKVDCRKRYRARVTKQALEINLESKRLIVSFPSPLLFKPTSIFNMERLGLLDSIIGGYGLENFPRNRQIEPVEFWLSSLIYDNNI